MNVDTNNDIEYYVGRLKHITGFLGRYSTIIFGIFLFSLIVIVLSFYFRLRGFLGYESQALAIFLMGLVLPVFGIIILFRFSQLSRRGMTYYEEITDEVEWGSLKHNAGRVPLNVRVATKEFLRATDMPIVKGNIGITIYFLLFILLIVVHSILSL